MASLCKTRLLPSNEMTFLRGKRALCDLASIGFRWEDVDAAKAAAAAV